MTLNDLYNCLLAKGARADTPVMLDKHCLQSIENIFITALDVKETPSGKVCTIGCAPEEKP